MCPSRCSMHRARLLAWLYVSRDACRDVDSSGPRLVVNAPTPGRGALRVLQFGAIAIVLAAATYKLFELDRYFVPKELALHLTALAAIIACLQGARRLELTRVESLFGAFLLLGIFSAVVATNHCASARAVGI